MPISFIETRRVSEAMRELGAVSPATARRAFELPELVRSDLERYVVVGVVREGAPGTYYLFEVKKPPLTVARILVVLLFWLVVVLIPVAILELADARMSSP
jgi:hypothetical protein